ncbi:menaquinone biosynthesis decarboxylase [Sulfurospirillum arcachonense]|uniref:menaquinone biosynthesis decarboxylase n=1 Tax=Sulfurospirillum arcachonense TaxID=57666 RepID=UPI000468ABB2|nr:menaquinone biosynthesis decarboxylase [Sulfurospirillum arcachonense]
MEEIIEELKKHNLLRVINDELDIDLEIPHIAYVEIKKEDSKALLFTNPISKRLNKKFDMPVLMNVFGSYEATELIFEKHPDDIANEIEELLHMKPPVGFMDKLGMLGKLFSLKNVFPKRLAIKGNCQKNVHENIDLNDLPILTTWSEDGGPFITMGHVYTESLDGTKQNLGMYRLQVYDDKRLGMHWQIHKDGAHFFHEYKKAGKKMPVSVAIGGDPLYIWCGQAPMPNGVFELLLYGLIREENARLVKSLTNPIYVPEDADIIIEGWVDPSKMEIEGPFGDHTGYYTLKEEYPVMDVTCITTKDKPIYQATVVGKPPLEDKYMGWATERIFLPLLKTTAPDLIDYNMPENGVFHNLILAKMKTMYPGHAKQFMHAFWGVGQMSFVKHAFFVGESAPDLKNYDEISDYILDRVSCENILISEGVCDALDHASPNACYGGKLGVDCTGDNVEFPSKNLLSEEKLYAKITTLVKDVTSIKQYKTHTKTPIVVLGVDKQRPTIELYKALKPLKEHMKLLVFVDSCSNELDNPYMLIWRIVNNIDAQRDIFLEDEYIGVDATNKSSLDGYKREWPGDTDTDQKTIQSLQERGLITKNKEFLKKYHV